MADLLGVANAAVDDAAAVVDAAARHLAHAAADGGRISVDRLDEHQVLAYDLAHAASALEGCRVMLEYGEHGELESLLARAFIADAVWDVASRVLGREATWVVEAADLSGALPFLETHRSPELLEELAAHLEREGTGPSHLGEDLELARETFHRFADDK